jgi:hypothetical protein
VIVKRVASYRAGGLNHATSTLQSPAVHSSTITTKSSTSVDPFTFTSSTTISRSDSSMSATPMRPPRPVLRRVPSSDITSPATSSSVNDDDNKKSSDAINEDTGEIVSGRRSPSPTRSVDGQSTARRPRLQRFTSLGRTPSSTDNKNTNDTSNENKGGRDGESVGDKDSSSDDEVTTGRRAVAPRLTRQRSSNITSRTNASSAIATPSLTRARSSTLRRTPSTRSM